jgi:hypothetical protein
MAAIKPTNLHEILFAGEVLLYNQWSGGTSEQTVVLTLVHNTLRLDCYEGQID